jgi:hypothetical protein
MAPRVREHPGTVAHRKGNRLWTREDERILAQRAQHSPTDEEQEGCGERNCFYCLEGWVFLGSLGHEAEEMVEAMRCRKCGGKCTIKFG